MFTTIITTIFWLSILPIIYSYMIYPVILWVMDKRRPVIEPVFASALPGVSIVISAYNEEQVIEHRIADCLSLDYPRDKLEIIIASDGSTDKTNDICETYKVKGVKCLSFSQRRGKVNVLNSIVPTVENDIVVFSDANTVFKKDAVKKIVRYFQEEDVGCVCGQLKFLNVDGSDSSEMEGLYWRYETFLKKREGKRGSLLGANGGIYAVRKKLFVPCPEDTIVEDFVLPMMILEKGHKVMYDPEAIAYEETAKHIVQEKERRIRIGAGDFQALNMLTPMLNPKRGFPALAFWSHKVLRWFTPFLMMDAFWSGCVLFFIGGLFYKILFIGQCAFYFSAFIGQALNWSGLKVKPLNLCYYFVSMNMALFLGFVRFVTNKQDVKWDRTER